MPGSAPERPLPAVTPENAFFWQAGAENELRFQRCASCERLRFPIAPVCPYCLSFEWVAAPVSGRATVVAVTVNYQPWTPAMDPPYAIAVVAIEPDG